MGKKLCIANWKMSVGRKDVRAFVSAFKNPKPNRAVVVIAAPFVYLDNLRKLNRGAQDVGYAESGAYTGDVSASMLKEKEVRYCLVGHSERRIYHSETDVLIHQKLLRLLESGIAPVLCIGENQAERKRGGTNTVLARQLQQGLAGITDPKKIVIAYEPIWAISTFQKGNKKITASDTDIIKAHGFIRSRLKAMFGKSGLRVPILYGGSVNAENSKNFINFAEVGGILVGAASRNAREFSAIIKSIR